MMLHIPEVLTRAQVTRCRAVLDAAPWIDGNATSGKQSAQAKRNRQLPEDSAEGRAVGDAIQDALGRNALFFSAALPLKVFPPLFNRYEGGEAFGAHIDNAIRHLKGTDFRIRTDLSATLFLEDPERYDGGELVIDDVYGEHRVKFAAGDMALYPASSLHHVLPVTRGVRVASFFWIQSMVRDDSARKLLFELDTSIQQLNAEVSAEQAVRLQLTGIYHNLLRRWSDC
jgi:PKHD-type hydroxylase